MKGNKRFQRVIHRSLFALYEEKSSSQRQSTNISCVLTLIKAKTVAMKRSCSLRHPQFAEMAPIAGSAGAKQTPTSRRMGNSATNPANTHGNGEERGHSRRTSLACTHHSGTAEEAKQWGWQRPPEPPKACIVCRRIAPVERTGPALVNSLKRTGTEGENSYFRRMVAYQILEPRTGDNAWPQHQRTARG